MINSKGKPSDTFQTVSRAEKNQKSCTPSLPVAWVRAGLLETGPVRASFSLPQGPRPRQSVSFRSVTVQRASHGCQIPTTWIADGEGEGESADPEKIEHACLPPTGDIPRIDRDDIRDAIKRRRAKQIGKTKIDKESSSFGFPFRSTAFPKPPIYGGERGVCSPASSVPLGCSAS